MKDIFFKEQFKGKKITVMGLGVLGRGLQVTQFLAKHGAVITVTDLKNKNDLKTSIDKLKRFNIRYVLGHHDIDDFKNADMIIKAAGVPLNSVYINEAKRNGIPISMDASLFSRIIRKTDMSIKIIGITGTRGKSMTTALIYHILKQNEKTLGSKIYLGGNMRAKATLPLLEKISNNDIVVLELDSWQCQGFGDEKISPDISVFTNLMPDHMNYYKNNMKAYFNDKSKIFKFQTKKDTLIASNEVLKILPRSIKSKVIIPKQKNIFNIAMNIFGEHNMQNALNAFSVAKECGLTDSQIIKSLKSFKGLEGRLQYLTKIKNVYVINDNNATTPEATIAGIKAVKGKYKKSNIILIMGGADKNLPLINLAKNIQKSCKSLIMLSGTGTERLKKIIKIPFEETNQLKVAVSKALSLAKKDDVILFSPGFASFGLFKNEYDRNDKFVSIIKKWK